MSKTHVVAKLYTDGRCDDAPCQMTLEEMQEFVGGYVEIVPTSFPHRSLICNESWMLGNLPQNPLATALAHPQTLIIDHIRGNVLLIKS